jgi:hypothetical protein
MPLISNSKIAPLVGIASILLIASPMYGDDSANREPGDGRSFLRRLDPDWGGHLRLRGRYSAVEESSLLALLQDDRLLDGEAELRLKNGLTLGRALSLETHYELVEMLGDTLEARNRAGDTAWLPRDVLEDDTRLFDLTKVVSDGDRHRLYHRIDRLALTYRPSWGTVVAGRQALTWGNGLLFNPMDLFNPFSPTDVEREYKIGDDMLNVSMLADKAVDLQVLAVPRRDPDTGHLTWSRSSFAAKMHSMTGPVELDCLVARHYRDMVGGIGISGYLGSAAWRTDATYTAFDDRSSRSGYLSVVANIDRSWVWAGRNWYGFIEAYFNGLGYDDPLTAMSDPALLERLDRGELYTTGRTYLGGTVQYEAHPLLNVYLTAINNLGDGSETALLRLVWDAAEDFRIVAGADLPHGSRDTEFGGVTLPETDGVTVGPAASVYLWVTRYF